MEIGVVPVVGGSLNGNDVPFGVAVAPYYGVVSFEGILVIGSAFVV